MKPRRTLFAALLVGAIAVAGAGLISQDRLRQAFADRDLRPNDLQTVALGAEIYGKECAACHGANLEGQPNWRRRLANGRLPAPPHDATGHTWHHPDDQLFDLTKYGPAGLADGDYETDMPAYQSVLTDAEILAVLSFIKSRWPREIRRRHDLLNARSGR